MKILAKGLKFPEGPVAMKDGSVCFVEIADGRISRVDRNGVVKEVARTGGGPNGMALGPDGAFYVCNNGGFLTREVDGETHVIHGELPEDYKTGSIQRVDPVTGAVSTLYTHCGDIALSAPNDIVFDAHGGFYFTDFGKIRKRSRDTGCVFYALPDGKSIKEVIHPIANPNGIGLSPDQRSLYVTETETSRLWAFNIVEPGSVEKLGFPSPNGGRLVCGLSGYQRFDSLAIQANGAICIGTLITGQITVIDPEGNVRRQLNMPESYPTNICFGGADMKKAYVTLSHTGQLIEMEWEEAGLPLNYTA
jgi:gluconolactonase